VLNYFFPYFSHSIYNYSIKQLQYQYNFFLIAKNQILFFLILANIIQLYEYIRSRNKNNKS